MSFEEKNPVDLDQITNLNEGIAPVEEVDLTESDRELAQKITNRISKHKGKVDELAAIAVKNREFYRGESEDDDELYEYESEASVNKIFGSIETLIPIVTAPKPDPKIVITPINANNNKLSNTLREFLENIWSRKLKMKKRLPAWVRNLLGSRFLIIKYGYNEVEDRFWFKLIPAGRAVFPTDASCTDDIYFLAELVDSTYGQIMELFFSEEDCKKDQNCARRKEAFIKYVQAKVGQDKIDADTKINYWEYWEDGEFTCKVDQEILYKGKNPNFNYEKIVVDKKTYEVSDVNHFKHPKMPYLFVNFINFEDQVIDDTTPIEQAKSLQQNINKRKRQFDANADMANGKIIVAGSAMSSEAFDAMTFSPKESIYLDKAETTQGAIDFVYGRGLDTGLYQDYVDSKNEIDNVFGTHSTTRGERESQETATGRAILKQSDMGRLDLLSNILEVLAEEMFNAIVQLIYVYVKEQYPVINYKKIDNKKVLTAFEKDNFILNSEFFGKKVEVIIEEGQMQPHDDISEKAEAVDLWKNGGLATVDLLRKLGYPNPEQLARNAYLERNNPAALYEQLGDDAFETEAIQHISAIVNAEDLESVQEIPIFNSSDPNIYEKHIRTQVEYIKGTEIDPDLPAYEELDMEVKALVKEHIEMENTQLAELIQAEQDRLNAMTNGMDLNAMLAQTQPIPEPALESLAAEPTPASPMQAGLNEAQSLLQPVV